MKTKRLLAYAGIVGGLVVATLGFFTLSQYFRARKIASDNVVMGAQMDLDKVYASDPNALVDENSPYHDKALWYDDIYTHFVGVNKSDSNNYLGTCITAYVLSSLSLISFGFVLKDAEKVKEKEEKEAV